MSHCGLVAVYLYRSNALFQSIQEGIDSNLEHVSYRSVAERWLNTHIRLQDTIDSFSELRRIKSGAWQILNTC
jgi:hypothetical protein